LAFGPPCGLATAAGSEGREPAAPPDRDLDAALFLGFVGANLRTAIARACKATGTPHFSPHGLRKRRGSLLSNMRTQVRTSGPGRSGFRIRLVEARQTVVREFVPGRPRGDEQVELRTDARIAVQRPESDSDFIPLWPLTAEQARAANRAERLHASVLRPEDPDQFLTGE
jgi:hypothetical protein